MKKIFTLLLAMGSLTMVFAQSGHRENVRNYFDQGNGYNAYHQNENSQFVQQNFAHGYDRYNEGRDNFGRGNERMRHDRMFQERRSLDNRRNYEMYSRPYHSSWNNNNYARRSFRNREW